MVVVKVFSGSVLVEEKTFTSSVKAVAWANYWQDEGYKVRFSA